MVAEGVIDANAGGGTASQRLETTSDFGVVRGCRDLQLSPHLWKEIPMGGGCHTR